MMSKAQHCFLVTAANGDLGEAVGGVLRDVYPRAELHGADSNGLWPGQVAFDTMREIPPAQAPDYLDALKAAADDVGASLIIPCHDEELIRLADPDAPNELPLLTAPFNLIRTFCDKLETARWLADHGFPTPETVPLPDATPAMLPIIIKPRRGSGAIGVRAIHTERHLLGTQDEYGNQYIGQDYLAADDAEFTCAIVRLQGKTRTLIMRRKLDGGKTIRITVEDQPEIRALLDRLAVAADLSGPLNVQLRLQPEGPMIFEINPRFSGTVRMRHLLGFRDLAWSIADLRGASMPDVQIPAGATVYRMSREVLGPQISTGVPK